VVASRRRRRYVRTVLLGCAALGTLLWAAVTQVGVPVERLWTQLLGTLVALLLVMAAAVAGLLALLAARRLWRALFADDSSAGDDWG
jgi:hypothetical protein